MKAEFNERSYEFAFTENLMKMLSPFAPSVPYFLSQRHEYRKGYDMRIKFKNGSWSPYFFQFKMPELMKTNSAREIKQYHANVTPPYYRMSLYPRDSYRQQNILADLEINNPNRVFYAVPEFHKYDDLNKYFYRRIVIKNSALFSPLDIRLAKSLSSSVNHTIAYNRRPRFGYLCSEPKKIDKHDFEEILLKDRHDGLEKRQPIEEKMDQLIKSGLSALDLNRRYFDSRVRECLEGGKHDDNMVHIYQMLVLGTLMKNHNNSNMFILFY